MKTPEPPYLVQTPSGVKLPCTSIFMAKELLKAYSPAKDTEPTATPIVFVLGHRVQLEIDENGEWLVANPSEVPINVINHILEAKA